MPNCHEHLDLRPTNKTFKRKIHGGGGYKPHNDIVRFAKEQTKKLDNMGKEFTKTSKQFPEYDQELTFKVKISQSVNEKDFRDRLKNVDCETLISTSGKNAEWIVSTSDPEFKKLKNKIKARTKKNNANFIDGISEFNNITFQDKLGPGLIEEPLGPIEKTRVVVSLTKKESDFNDDKLNKIFELISNLVKKYNSDNAINLDDESNLDDEFNLAIYDKLITNNMCLILLDTTLDFIKSISRIDLVEKIDRPPKFFLEKVISKFVPNLENITSSDPNNHGVLVMDSGIILHPLLEPAIDQNNGIVGLPDRINQDDRHHGTMVSGIALHGDIQKCISDNNFNSDVRIYSSKIFYESDRKLVDLDDTLIETKIKESLEEIKSKFPKCKIVNLSFGDDVTTMIEGTRQFDLAVLIDDLANKYSDMIFVIAAGNIRSEYTTNAKYPDYLLSDDPNMKIVDPATSAHAISVGSVQRFGQVDNQPSNFSKIGPGLNGMIKPEFVENGGGFDDNVIVLNPNYRQRSFSLNKGTSFSAPKIAHYLARLYNKFPSYDRNLITSLLISSANLPENMPDIFPKINSTTLADQWLKLLSVYGFGKPNLDNAMSSDDDRVVVKHSGKIKMNQVQYFTINLPDEFVKEKGNREISVSLVYDPPIRKDRADYFGVHMEFRLFRNMPIKEVMKKFNSVDLNNTEEIIFPKTLKNLEIVLKPGPALRKKSVHQKGIRTLSTAFKMSNEHPLVLVVLSQKRWDLGDDYEQNFAVVVTLKHKLSFDLYNKLRIKNPIRIRV